MPDNKKKRKPLILRILKALLILAILGVVGLVGWIYLMPMVTQDTVTTYAAYTAGRGDISTYKSLAATLSVKKSETFTSTEECTVREMYVTAGQEVAKGDDLVLLSTGELFQASFDGVVNETRVKTGDYVWANFSIIQVCDLQHLSVSTNADEYDIKEFAVGQPCTVKIISLDVDFETTIAHINRVSASNGSVAYYSVSCDLTVPENILPGMQATIIMPSDSVTDVVTLDMGALAFDDDKKPYVLTKNADGTYDRVSVETGVSDGMNVEIKSGLSEGDVVYAVTGTESVEATLTFQDIYNAIFGTKVVINEASSGRGNRGGVPTMSEDGAMSDFSQMGDGTMPTMSEDGTMPDFSQMGDGSAPNAANGEDAAADDTSTTTDAEQANAAADTSGAEAASTSDAQSSADTAENASQPSSGERPDGMPSGERPSGAPSGERPQSTDSAQGGTTDEQ